MSAAREIDGYLKHERSCRCSLCRQSAAIDLAFTELEEREAALEAKERRTQQLAEAMKDAVSSDAPLLRSLNAPGVPGVYFLQSSNRIKIGVSRNMATRVADLATACPTRTHLVAYDLVTNADTRNHLEQLRHSQFQHLRLVGEWFAYADELREFLDPWAGPVTWTRESIFAELRIVGDKPAVTIDPPQRIVADSSRYYSSSDAPCGARAFLAAARAGKFKSYGTRRKVLALREDVHRWIEAQPRVIKMPPAGDTMSNEELLARAGVRLTR